MTCAPLRASRHTSRRGNTAYGAIASSTPSRASACDAFGASCKPGADLAELRGAFEHAHGPAGARDRERGGEPADPAAGDQQRERRHATGCKSFELRALVRDAHAEVVRQHPAQPAGRAQEAQREQREPDLVAGHRGVARAGRVQAALALREVERVQRHARDVEREVRRRRHAGRALLRDLQIVEEAEKRRARAADQAGLDELGAAAREHARLVAALRRDVEQQARDPRADRDRHRDRVERMAVGSGDRRRGLFDLLQLGVSGRSWTCRPNPGTVGAFFFGVRRVAGGAVRRRGIARSTRRMRRRVRSASRSLSAWTVAVLRCVSAGSSLVPASGTPLLSSFMPFASVACVCPVGVPSLGARHERRELVQAGERRLGRGRQRLGRVARAVAPRDAKPERRRAPRVPRVRRDEHDLARRAREPRGRERVDARIGLVRAHAVDREHVGQQRAHAGVLERGVRGRRRAVGEHRERDVLRGERLQRRSRRRRTRASCATLRPARAAAPASSATSRCAHVNASASRGQLVEVAVDAAPAR